MNARTRIAVISVVGVLWLAGTNADAGLHRTFITGEAGEADVIFGVTLDPAVAGSAVIGVAVRDVIRLDGIDYAPGTTKEVVVGAQFPAAGGGAIRHYDVATGSPLVHYVPATDAFSPGPTWPSTVLTTPDHIYYTENQFGFAGAGGLHRIMRAPVAGAPGPVDTVFDGAGAGLVNFEGLEVVGDRLYFFARDEASPPGRALYSIGLTGAGLWDTVAPTKHLGGLEGHVAGDGSDELDYDPLTGKIYGSNILNGEVIVWDPVGASGGFLISEADILGGAPDGLGRLGTAALDGIRSTGDGYLVLTGLDGVILSIDIAGAAAGPDDSDIKILYDDRIANRGLRFDDLTPMSPVPEPATGLLVAAGLASLAGYLRRWRRT